MFFIFVLLLYSSGNSSIAIPLLNKPTLLSLLISILPITNLFISTIVNVLLVDGILGNKDLPSVFGWKSTGFSSGIIISVIFGISPDWSSGITNGLSLDVAPRDLLIAE